MGNSWWGGGAQSSEFLDDGTIIAHLVLKVNRQTQFPSPANAGEGKMVVVKAGLEPAT